MSRRIRVLLGCLTALPLALIVLSFGAGTASATTGGCLFPSTAAEVYADQFFDQLNEASDPKLCEKQCKEFRDSCRRICSLTAKCLKEAFGGLTDANNQDCKEEETSEDRKSCKNENNEDQSSFEDEVDADKQECEDICEEVYQNCLDDCVVL